MGKSPSEHPPRLGTEAFEPDFARETVTGDLRDQVQILVVDDDPSFGKIMSRIGHQSHVHVTVCRSFQELHRVAPKRFHAAIIDFDLGGPDGIEVARLLEKENGKLPIILVSQSQVVETPISYWPANVKGFLHKALGHFAILEAALAAHDARLIHSVSS